nr:hypothetical protein REQ54_03027 [Rhizobium sp. Q54]
MLGFVAETILRPAGAIVEWYAGRDANGFAIHQLIVALIAMALFCIAVLYWPRVWRGLLHR